MYLLEHQMADSRKQQVMGEIRAKMAVEARITTGAPYSAEALMTAS